MPVWRRNRWRWSSWIDCFETTTGRFGARRIKTPSHPSIFIRLRNAWCLLIEFGMQGYYILCYYGRAYLMSTTNAHARIQTPTTSCKNSHHGHRSSATPEPVVFRKNVIGTSLSSCSLAPCQGNLCLSVTTSFKQSCSSQSGKLTLQNAGQWENIVESKIVSLSSYVPN